MTKFENSYFNPITLEAYNNINPESLKYTYLNDISFKKTKILVEEPDNLIDIDKFSKYLYNPPITIKSDDILIIYNINNLIDLRTYINDNIYVNYFTINRIINCLIEKNITILKEHNKILLSIFKILIKKTNLFKLYKIKIDLNNINIDKIFKKYFIKFINIKNIYNYDLFGQFILFLKKNYNT